MLDSSVQCQKNSMHSSPMIYLRILQITLLSVDSVSLYYFYSIPVYPYFAAQSFIVPFSFPFIHFTVRHALYFSRIYHQLEFHRFAIQTSAHNPVQCSDNIVRVNLKVILEKFLDKMTEFIKFLNDNLNIFLRHP